MKERHFISNNEWFELDYPPHWTEFEEDDGTYLFMDNDNWKGNLRITPIRYYDASGAIQVEKSKAGIESELEKESGAQMMKIGKFNAVKYERNRVQDGDSLRIHSWIIDGHGTLLICSFTIDKNRADDPEVIQEVRFAEKTLSSIKVN